LSEVEATCHRAVVIAEGRLVAQGSIEEIRQAQRTTARLALVIRGESEQALRLVRTHETVAQAELADSGATEGCCRIEVEFETSTEPIGETAEGLADAIIKAGLGLRELVPLDASLEQLFAQLTDSGSLVATSSGSSCRTAQADGEQQEPES